MLKLKKAVRCIFDSVEVNSLQIEQVMEKSFKKLLEGHETTKNLAEYADFTVK
jgi:hypothetical protein